MACHADLQWHCEHAGVARVFDAGQGYGDPYCYALPFVVVEGGVEFIGLATPIRPCQWRAIKAACRAHGLRVFRTRIRGGQKQTREVKCLGKLI